MRYISLIAIFVFIVGCSNQPTPISQIEETPILDSLDNSISIKKENYYFAKTKNKKYNIKSLFSPKWKYVYFKKGKTTYKFAIMKSPVTISNKNHSPLTDISYNEMNNICMKRYNGILVSAYVFDKARRLGLIYKPKNVNSEIVAPLDEEDDTPFINTKDNIIVPDGMILKFDWDTQTYNAISNVYQSNNATFRCMRIK